VKDEVDAAYVETVRLPWRQAHVLRDSGVDVDQASARVAHEMVVREGVDVEEDGSAAAAHLAKLAHRRQRRERVVDGRQ